MSLLAHNLKVVRRELRLTQAEMAEVLKIGFRSYVRYEVDERDAPVAVLIKIAQLGNLSLEEFLKVEITPSDVVPLKKNTTIPAGFKVGRCDFKEGKIKFDQPKAMGLVERDISERKLLRLFRKMDTKAQKCCLKAIIELSEKSRLNPKSFKNYVKKEVHANSKSKRLLVKETELKTMTLKQIKKPGRKKGLR